MPKNEPDQSAPATLASLPTNEARKDRLIEAIGDNEQGVIVEAFQYLTVPEIASCANFAVMRYSCTIACRRSIVELCAERTNPITALEHLLKIALHYSGGYSSAEEEELAIQGAEFKLFELLQPFQPLSDESARTERIKKVREHLAQQNILNMSAVIQALLKSITDPEPLGEEPLAPTPWADPELTRAAVATCYRQCTAVTPAHNVANISMLLTALIMANL